LRALWNPSAPVFEGDYYSTSGFSLEPFPSQPAGPPIWLGSWGSAAGLRRVARLADGWLASGYNTTPERFLAARRDLAQYLEAAGKDSASFPNGIATMWTYVTEDRSRAESILSDLLVPMLGRSAAELGDQLPIGPAEKCAETLAAYARAGAQRVFIWPLADELDQLQRFWERVVPLIERDSPTVPSSA
jgi:alkanesulfonate monooxygenase SsuD/methylene tetrahydromethanopterin reductase-like flavin-dependent oxidoreductase (luciferase family)